MTNSAKFCSAGKINLAARIYNKEKYVEVDVSDTGKGISPTAIKRIFEPFEQENGSEARGYQVDLNCGRAILLFF
jgi:signal transduction histidine kinase